MEVNWKKYQRQMMLPGFGQAKQQKLLDAKVLIIGAGGLGCPALLYLAAAGVGQIGIIDFDRVELSNLHRQILFSEMDLGLFKAEVAAQKIRTAYPGIQVDHFNEALNEGNAKTLIEKYDLVLDGSDNFDTRYLVDDICKELNKPWVYGSVSRYECQVCVFNLPFADGRKYSYRDLYPNKPMAGVIENCAEAGVLGTLTGIAACMQANETIKIICGIGLVLNDKLLTFHALQQKFYEIAFGPMLAQEEDTLTSLREALDRTDRQLLGILAARKQIVQRIAQQKQMLGMEIIQTQQWKNSLQKRLQESEAIGLDASFISEIFNKLHIQSIKDQEDYDNK